jgi:hypothetical protein
LIFVLKKKSLIPLLSQSLHEGFVFDAGAFGNSGVATGTDGSGTTGSSGGGHFSFRIASGST